MCLYNVLGSVNKNEIPNLWLAVVIPDTHEAEAGGC